MNIDQCVLILLQIVLEKLLNAERFLFCGVDRIPPAARKRDSRQVLLEFCHIPAICHHLRNIMTVFTSLQLKNSDRVVYIWLK